MLSNDDPESARIVDENRHLQLHNAQLHEALKSVKDLLKEIHDRPDLGRLIKPELLRAHICDAIAPLIIPSHEDVEWAAEASQLETRILGLKGNKP